jgi:hypothetical protein
MAAGSCSSRCFLVLLLGLPAAAAQATLTLSAGQGFCDRFGDRLLSCALISTGWSRSESPSPDLYNFAKDNDAGLAANERRLLTTRTEHRFLFSLGPAGSDDAGGWHYQPDPQDQFIPLVDDDRIWSDPSGAQSLAHGRGDTHAPRHFRKHLFDREVAELARPIPLALMIGLTSLILVGILRGLRPA